MDGDLSPPATSSMQPRRSEYPTLPETISGSVFLISAAGELLRLPIPSTSPRDPLAWNQATRMTAFVCGILFSSIGAVTVNLPSMIQPGLMHDFPDWEERWFGVKTLSSAMTLCVSFGYLLAIPLSTAVGRRPVVLVTSAVIAFMVLWSGLASDYSQLLVATCFQGIGVGSTLSMCLLMLMDATFIHERPWAFSIFWVSGALFLSVFILLLPYIMDTLTQWRLIYEVWFGPCLIVFLLALLFIPETYFIRPPIALDGRVLVQSSSEKVQIYDNWESVPCGSHCPHNRTHEPPGPSKWVQRIKVRRAPDTSWKGAMATCAQMVLCLSNPLLIWVSLLSASILSGVIFMGLMIPNHLIAILPQSQREEMGIWLGVSNIIALLVAIPATGPLITWCTKYYALRCGGTRHAEAYLPGFMLPVVSSVLGLGLFGLTKSHHWPVGLLYFAFALSNFSYVTANVAIILWITEAFPSWAAASLAVQMFTTNIVAFAVGISLLTWVSTAKGLLSNIVILVLVLTLGAFAVPIAFWGKTVRQYIHGRWSESAKGAIRPH